jgi:hypothetical protein
LITCTEELLGGAKIAVLLALAKLKYMCRYPYKGRITRQIRISPQTPTGEKVLLLGRGNDRLVMLSLVEYGYGQHLRGAKIAVKSGKVDYYKMGQCT